MKTTANLLILIVAVLHFWFMILEMFLWTRPIGLKTFGNSRAKAESMAVLAANQGLYNGFLAAGLLWSIAASDSAVSLHFQVFFLSCVLVAGLYGAWSVSRKILFVQALPAAIALVFVLCSNPLVSS